MTTNVPDEPSAVRAQARWLQPAGAAPFPPAVMDALVRSHLLDGIDIDLRDEMAAHVYVHRLVADERLFRAGDHADRLFVVVDGTLHAELDTENGRQSLAEFRPGDVVGEIGVLAGGTRSATVRAATDCELVSITPAGLQRVLAENPVAAEELTRRATDRLRRTQVLDQFAQLFGVIDREVLEAIEELVDWVTIPAGTRLFAEGDDADAAYLVASGRLRAVRRTPTGAEIDVGEISRAELVGEMSLIDGEPRGASMYAVRDSQLIRFSREAYDELLRRYPRVGLEVAQVALRRTRGDAARPSAGRLSVVVVPATPGVDVRTFAGQLADALGPSARRVGSADIDRELGRDGIAQIGPNDVGSFRLSYHLEELEELHRHLVYEVDDTWTPWSRRALRWADRILLVADAERDPAPGALEQELWSLVAGHHHPNVSLALLHPSGTELPTGTQAWLEPRVLASHHHLRRGDDAHLARLARLLAGTGTSLVLGGGGARGFAHLGVLQALEEQGTPVDMVAGTSIGAIMAALPAMGMSAAEAREVAVDRFRDLFDYTLPRTSLLRGERITSKLQATFGDVDITDLWVPFFCVSTNLTHATAKYHDAGSLTRALRASISIPGVLPPVPDDGDLLVDGGVLENVPVDEMRRRNPTGRIVAVDVAPVEGPVAEGDYGLSVSGLRSSFGRRHGRPPNLLSTMVRSSLLASVRDRQRVVDNDVADLYLDLAVDGGAMLDFSTGDRIADGAAASVRGVLAGWRDRPDAGGYVHTTPAREPLIDPSRRRRRRGVLLLTLRDLRYRAARFAAVVVGISVVFTLLFLMTGLTEQFHREPRSTVDAFGAEAWLVRDGASGAFTSAATMPASVAGDVDGVAASPVVVGRHSITEGATHTDAVVVGFDPGGLGEPVLVDGTLPDGPGEAVVDRSAGIGVGEELRLGDERFTVTGRTSGTTLFAGMPLVHLELDTAQALLYRGQDLATAVLLDGRPEEVPDGFTALTDADVAEDALRPLERPISSVNMIRILLWFVAAMIIGTMTYLSALERRRDVAVLKAIGGSTGQLGASIALQGALIAIVASAMAAGLQTVVSPVFPLEVSVPTRALFQVPTIAVVVALLAGIVGVRKAVRTDPALAFSGPGS